MGNGVDFRKLALDLRGQLTAAQSELAALREELADLREAFANRVGRVSELSTILTASERRNADIIEVLQMVKDNGGAMEDHEWDRVDAALKPTESGASE